MGEIRSHGFFRSEQAEYSQSSTVPGVAVLPLPMLGGQRLLALPPSLNTKTSIPCREMCRSLPSQKAPAGTQCCSSPVCLLWGRSPEGAPRMVGRNSPGGEVEKLSGQTRGMKP